MVGYREPSSVSAPLSKHTFSFVSYSSNSINGRVLQGEIRALIEKGAVELAPLHGSTVGCPSFRRLLVYAV